MVASTFACAFRRLPKGVADEVEKRIGHVLTNMQQDGAVLTAQRVIYEPEVYLFGGSKSIDLIHELFQLESSALLSLGMGNRKTNDLFSALWSEAMLRVAGLDAFERWDVWCKVSELRRPAKDLPRNACSNLREKFAWLARAHSDEIISILRQRFPNLSSTVDTLARWGEVLQEANRIGRLERGLRDILATCLIFHWNRCMYGPTEQSLLAKLHVDAAHADHLTRTTPSERR